MRRTLALANRSFEVSGSATSQAHLAQRSIVGIASRRSGEMFVPQLTQRP
jgi:hypothetical protein